MEISPGKFLGLLSFVATLLLCAVLLLLGEYFVLLQVAGVAVGVAVGVAGIWALDKLFDFVVDGQDVRIWPSRKKAHTKQR